MIILMHNSPLRVARPLNFLLSLISFVALAGVLVMNLAFQPPAAHAASTDVLVSNGSPSTPFPLNKQNEPAIAVEGRDRCE